MGNRKTPWQIAKMLRELEEDEYVSKKKKLILASDKFLQLLKQYGHKYAESNTN